jgi:putative hydrolase of the HAD superfamily
LTDYRSKSHDRALFWDFDGTLAYRPGMWSGILLAVLRDADPSTMVTREDIGPFVRQGFPWHTPDLPHPALNQSDRWWENLETVFSGAFVGVGVSGDLARELAERVRARFLDAADWVVFGDTVPTLHLCAERGWRQYVLSNHVPELPALVASLDLAGFFEEVISSANVGYEKPHPEIYAFARGAAGDPENIWMIGDSVEADVLGAERAGLRAILVRGTDPRAKYCCARLPDCVKIIEEKK